MSDSALHPQLSVMGVDDAPGNTETVAVPLLLGGESGVKNVLDVLAGDPRSVILDLYENHRRLWIVAHAHHDFPLIRLDRLQCVQTQVGYGISEQALVRLDPGHPFLLDPQADPTSAGVASDRVHHPSHQSIGFDEARGEAIGGHGAQVTHPLLVQVLVLGGQAAQVGAGGIGLVHAFQQAPDPAPGQTDQILQLMSLGVQPFVYLFAAQLHQLQGEPCQHLGRALFEFLGDVLVFLRQIIRFHVLEQQSCEIRIGRPQLRVELDRHFELSESPQYLGVPHEHGTQAVVTKGG